jgi:pilus assembly protein Flp/PilA
MNVEYIVSLIKGFLREEEGVTAIEYALIAALIAVVIIIGATAVGLNINAMFQYIAGQLSGSMP